MHHPVEHELGKSHCPVCQSNQLKVMYPAEIESPSEVSFSYTFSPVHNRIFQVIRCKSCTHAFCSPIPKNIAENYKDVVDDEYLKHSESRKLSAISVLQRIRQYQPSGKLLDVGCATGDLLEVASKLGYASEGLELSDWSSGLAQARGFKIHRQFLEDFVLDHSEQYDVITLMGVIEHFSQPEKELKHIARLLKPNGVLVIWTGDVDSITSRLLKRKWWYWQSQHIQYFTHKSLKKLVTQAGLFHLATRTYPFGASYETLSNSLRRYRSHKALQKIIKPFFRLRTTWPLYVPGEMLMIAKR